MAIRIAYQEQHNISEKICELLKLILNNMKLLIVVSNMDIDIEMYKIGKVKYNKEEILESKLEDLEFAGGITEEESNKFKDLWIKAEAENELGKLLEEIIAKSGPYYQKYDEYNYSRESKVKETNKESNFDVIFYDTKLSQIDRKEKLVILTQGEFHECKKNVCNEIPCNEEFLKDTFKRKLDFIKDVYNLTNKGLFYIPTFKYNVTGSEKFLMKNGYEFIEIINIQKMINRYCT